MVKNNILLATLIRRILFIPLENKLHIFALPCNILYVVFFTNFFVIVSVARLFGLLETLLEIVQNAEIMFLT